MSRRPKRSKPPQAHAIRQRGKRAIRLGKARKERLLPPDSLPDGRHRYRAWVVCGLLLLAVGLVFGQTVRHDFINLDDPEYVSENPHVTRGLSTEGIVWALTHRHHYNWCPLVWWSFMLDSQFFGPKPWGYHLTNVLLHAATAIGLFLVLRRMTGRLWPSAVAAAIFAVHPLRVESVAWVTERKDVLSGLFFMLTLWAYVGYVRHRFSLVRYLGIMLLFALGLMAKPAVATLPAVLLLLDYWPLGRFNGARGPGVRPGPDIRVRKRNPKSEIPNRQPPHASSFSARASTSPCVACPRKAPAVAAGGRVVRVEALGPE